jgi:hypothetical protein
MAPRDRLAGVSAQAMFNRDPEDIPERRLTPSFRDVRRGARHPISQICGNMTNITIFVDDSVYRRAHRKAAAEVRPTILPPLRKGGSGGVS